MSSWFDFATTKCNTIWQPTVKPWTSALFISAPTKKSLQSLLTMYNYLPSCLCLIRWQFMTMYGQWKTPWLALQLLVNPQERVHPYQRERPAPMWRSTPYTLMGWNKDTGTSCDNRMGLSLRWDINILYTIVLKTHFHNILEFGINTRSHFLFYCFLLTIFRVYFMVWYWRWDWTQCFLQYESSYF